MKTIGSNKKNKKFLNILIVEKNQIFYNEFKLIAKEFQDRFPNIHFKIKNIKDPQKLTYDLVKKADLTFIKDTFLLEGKLTPPTDMQQKKDIIILICDQFEHKTLVKIKQVIDENSLNLSGHISLTNYTFNLTRLLVIDFLITKLQLYDYKEI